MCHSSTTSNTRCTTCNRRSNCSHRRNCPSGLPQVQLAAGNGSASGRASGDAPPAYGMVVGEVANDELTARKRGFCGRGRAEKGGYERKGCRGGVRGFVGGLIQRHIEKKEQKERGFPAVGGQVDGVGMGRRQEVGVVEEGGLDEKYFGFGGGDVTQDGFEKHVKILERSVGSIEL